MQPESTATATDTSTAAPAADQAAAAAATAAPDLSLEQSAFASFFEKQEASAAGGDSPTGQPAQASSPAADAAATAATSATAATGTDAANADAAASAAAAAAASAAAAANPFAELGEGFTDFASVKAALDELGLLRANQLTDEHRQAIALASDPEKLARYAALTAVDYSKMPDKEVLFEKFKQDNPDSTPRALKKDFEELFDTKYKALAYEDETDEDYLTAKERIENDVKRARTAMDTARTTELAALKPAITAPAEDTSKAQKQADYDAHVARAAEIAKAYKGTAFPIEGAEPFVVTPSDPKAFEEALTNPVRYLLSQITAADGSIDYEKNQEIALALVERSNLVNYGVKHAKNLGAVIPLKDQANMPEAQQQATQQPAEEDWKKDFVKTVKGS